MNHLPRTVQRPVGKKEGSLEFRVSMGTISVWHVDLQQLLAGRGILRHDGPLPVSAGRGHKEETVGIGLAQ